MLLQNAIFTTSSNNILFVRPAPELASKFPKLCGLSNRVLCWTVYFRKITLQLAQTSDMHLNKRQMHTWAPAYCSWLPHGLRAIQRNKLGCKFKGKEDLHDRFRMCNMTIRAFNEMHSKFQIPAHAHDNSSRDKWICILFFY